MRNYNDIKSDLDANAEVMTGLLESAGGSGWSDEGEKRWKELGEENTNLELEFAAATEHRNKERELAELSERRAEQVSKDKGTTGEMRSNREGRDQGQTVEQRNSLAVRGWMLGAKAKEVHQRALTRQGISAMDSELELRMNTDIDHVRRSPLVECHGGKMANYEWRQQATTPIADGGALVPPGLLRPLETALLQYGGLRGVADVSRMSTGEKILWPTLNDTAVVAEIIDQNAAHNQGDMTFAQVATTPWKYSSKYVLVSHELMMDSSESMDGIVGRALGERVGRGTSAHYAAGTGTTMPRGILVDALDSTVVLDGINAPTFANLLAIEHALDPAYRAQNAMWIFPDVFLQNVKGLVDLDGRPLFIPGVANGAPNTILGYPYVIDQSIPSAISVACVGFGALNRYKIHDAGSIFLQRANELFMLNSQIGFLATFRTDGRLLDAGTGPVVYATNPAT